MQDAATAAAAKAAAEDATKVTTGSRAFCGVARPKMDPRQMARLEALKGKYGTHVASNMKQQAVSKQAAVDSDGLETS